MGYIEHPTKYCYDTIVKEGMNRLLWSHTTVNNTISILLLFFFFLSIPTKVLGFSLIQIHDHSQQHPRHILSLSMQQRGERIIITNSPLFGRLIKGGKKYLLRNGWTAVEEEESCSTTTDNNK